jgi:nicotinamide-nucleotide amidase
MFPETSRVIPNLNGTAPGIDLSVARPDRNPSRIFALPGVPAEMREMWKHSVAPAIAEILGPSRHVIRYHCVKCFGVGESELERMLPDMIRRGRIPTVGITASKATLTLRISAEAASDEAFHSLCEPTVKTIRELLGTLIFSEDDGEELQHVVVRLLATQHRSLATVEFGSGGLLSQWLSDADASGRVYRGGLVLPPGAGSLSNSNQVPAVTTNLPLTYFPPRKDEASAAGEYAETARSLLGADYALAIGSFPPSDSNDQKPGDVHLGLASPHGRKVYSHAFAGHPELLRERTLKQALNALRLELESADIAPPR